MLAALTAWTNTAGRVISAEPVRIEGSSVVMRCGNGPALRTLPMTLFPTGEQVRIKATLGVRELPVALRELRSAFAAELTRAEQRHAGGACSDEDYAAKRARILSAWQKALTDARLPAADMKFWEGKLKP